MERSFSAEGSTSNNTELANLFGQKGTLLSSLSKGFAGKALKVLVTMSTLLDIEDYRRLIPHLWGQLSNEGDVSLTAAVSPFL
jgi:hypothetical protein